jgi:isopenicillin N synthase-like dioxygenase
LGRDSCRMHVSRVSRSCRIGQRHSSHISSVSLTDPPRRIFDALSATGFLYLRDAVPETAPILRASRRFFQLPADVKETARSNVSRSPKGYHRRFRQGDEMEALTEAFTFGLEVQSPRRRRCDVVSLVRTTRSCCPFAGRRAAPTSRAVRAYHISLFSIPNRGCMLFMMRT